MSSVAIIIQPPHSLLMDLSMLRPSMPAVPQMPSEGTISDSTCGVRG